MHDGSLAGRGHDVEPAPRAPHARLEPSQPAVSVRRECIEVGGRREPSAVVAHAETRHGSVPPHGNLDRLGVRVAYAVVERLLWTCSRTGNVGGKKYILAWVNLDIEIVEPDRL